MQSFSSTGGRAAEREELHERARDDERASGTLMPLTAAFYVRLSAACFVLGGCMELFMIKTGFYDVVTRNEADKWEERRDEAVRLRSQVAEALKRRGVVDLPPELERHLPAAAATSSSNTTSTRQ